MSDILVGYVACFIAIFFFGSNFAPIKVHNAIFRMLLLTI